MTDHRDDESRPEDMPETQESQPEEQSASEPQAEEPVNEDKDFGESLPDEAEPESAFDDQAPASKSDEEKLVMPSPSGKQNVTLELELLKEIAENIRETPERLAQVIQDSIASFNYTGGELSEGTNWSDSEAVAERVKNADPQFQEAFQKAMGYTDSGGVGEQALEKEGSEWGQILSAEGQRFGMGVRRVPTSGEPKLTGADAKNHVRALLGLSRPQFFPCVHSGFWIELTPPKLSSVALLCQRILDEKDSVGRRGKAVLLSNNTVFIREHLIDFILKHVTWTNYEHKDADSLRSAISLLDYPAMVVGMAATLWPERYPLTIPCIEDEMKCQHLNVYDLWIHRMVVFNKAALTEEQRKQLAMNRTTVTEADVAKYKAQMLEGEPERTVKVSEHDYGSIYVTFKHPVLQEHLDQGKQWVHGINERVLEEMGSASREDMDEMMGQLAALSITREHSHWVKEIVVEYGDGSGDGGRSVTSEQDDIMENLETIVEDDKATEAFFEGLKAFITDSTCAVAGVPRVRCTKCGARLGGEDGRNPLAFTGAYDTNSLIPIDVETTFFTLALSRATVEM